MTETPSGELRRAVEQLERKSERLYRLIEGIERARQSAEAEGRQFTAPTEEQLAKRAHSPHTPLIVFQAWSGSVPAGGTLSYSVGIGNPDPNDWLWVFGHVFVGLASIAGAPGHAALAVDARFPRLTSPAMPGLTIAAGSTGQLDVEISVPDVEPSAYLGNTFVFQATWHDPSDYLDRSLFVFEVT